MNHSPNTLHIINSSSAELWREMLRVIQPDDAIVLLADGAYALSKPLLQSTLSAQHVFALDSDVTARAMNAHVQNVQVINYGQFVDICTQYQKTVSWL